MWSNKAARVPVAAGDTRSQFGHALDTLLPLSERRRAFRRWRHTRPFWAGVLVILGGIWLLYYPVGPLPQMAALGSAGMTAVAVGLILVVGGLFFWFAPHQRMFISIVLMICSVMSLVVSNFGGFLAGMIFGMIGSAMAFGWKPGGDYKRKGAPGMAAKPTPVARGSAATKRAAAVAAIGVLTASGLTPALHMEPALALPGPAAAQGDRPGGRPPLPAVACGTTNVETATLVGQDVVIRGTTFIKDGCGNDIEVVDLFIPSADLTEYMVTSPGGTFEILTDLHIEQIELLTPELNANIDVGKLVANQLGLGSIAELLPDFPIGPVPITPELVGLLDDLGLLPFTINELAASPADWEQPLIRGGTVQLLGDPELRIVGPPPPIG